MTKTEFINLKICKNYDELNYLLSIWRFKEKKIVLSYGNFDLLHFGNIDYLANSADFGDILIVGVQNNPKHETIQDAGKRAFNVAALNSVACVVFFDEDPYELLKIVEPDTLSYKDKQQLNSSIIEYVERSGINVQKIDNIPGFSSFEVLEKIKTI
ncbi:MAG: hypothetical protein JXL97_10865 [Bacteroidales bacterium]|nr:hypothetical protein [Bacteroidales bacterium]